MACAPHCITVSTSEQSVKNITNYAVKDTLFSFTYIWWVILQGLELFEKRNQGNGPFFPTSLHDLDNVLHGGVPMGTVTEVREWINLFTGWKV